MPQQRSALIRRREEMGLSRRALAGKVGVSVTAVGTWERGTVTPSGYHMSALAQALGVSIRELEELLAATEGNS